MIADDRESLVEGLVKLITVPLWGPIYVTIHTVRKLREARERDPHVKVEELGTTRWVPNTELERVVFAALLIAGRPISNAEFARLMGVSAPEASKRITELAHLLEQGVIQKQRVGREVRLSLPHYH